MTKQEISEIKKLLTPRNCSITRICGCYVDGEKNKKALFGQAFLALPEEEMFKYFEILRKALSGTLGKNLLNLEFPLSAEWTGDGAAADGLAADSPETTAEGPAPEGTGFGNGSAADALNAHGLLLRLRDSKLKDDALLEEYFDRIIENYEFVGNYLILLVHDVYDVPGRASDGMDMEDASDEIYEYILACICPVELSKPGLSYNPEENAFQNRVRDWVVSLPDTGFLFPSFNDRSADIHSLLYYSKNPEELQEGFVDRLFGCPLPLSAGDQKETFQTLIEDTLGEDCSIEMVRDIHERFTELAQENKEAPEPVVLDKTQVKTILADSGVANEKLSEFDRHYDETAGESTSLLMNNIMETRSFEVKTPDIVIKVKPDRTNLIETRQIDGRECLVIALDGGIVVNGITVRTAGGQGIGPDETDDIS
ncbi:DUF4317 domain-containing protein [uncultured Acetatifactor sp.]|uniref:DUF4317 domain-containing protein n=1 Tax=uncultured Acetatifactor sp. TaxID=1671927 RepID=UPI0026389A3B|nr:DUF4317 domain-containing protein [uncultured Acetatifactor sp.]